MKPPAGILRQLHTITAMIPLATADHLTECATELHGLDVLEVGCAHLHQGAAMSLGHSAQFLILVVGAIALVVRA